MRLCVFVEPQLGASYTEQLRIARAAEELGFDGLFRSDHYLTMGGGDGLPGPTDSWLTLAALARETSRIRLGTLVSSATFRYPGPLAIAVAQVDEMSGGRVELGLGAGWYEAEHTGYGIPFPPTGERFDRLAEQLEIITGLWATPPGGRFDFKGRHYTLTDSPALPKPVQTPRPPVIVGGQGPRRTPALAARFADEYNFGFGPVYQARAQYERVRDACGTIGRQAPPALSVALPVCCGRTEAERRRRAERSGLFAPDPEGAALYGTPEEVVDRLGRYREAGAGRAYLQFVDHTDLDHVALVAAEVAPHLA